MTTIILNYACKFLSFNSNYISYLWTREHMVNSRFDYSVEITISNIWIDGCTRNGISSILARPSSKEELQATPHGDQNPLWP